MHQIRASAHIDILFKQFTSQIEKFPFNSRAENEANPRAVAAYARMMAAHVVEPISDVDSDDDEYYGVGGIGGGGGRYRAWPSDADKFALSQTH
jgi:hypothetical protein